MWVGLRRLHRQLHPICHLDRSEAQWRDLRFQQFSAVDTALLVISLQSQGVGWSACERPRLAARTLRQAQGRLWGARFLNSGETCGRRLFSPE